MRFFTLFIAFIVLYVPNQASAQISLIRDSEIEYYLHEWSEGVIDATGLDPESINLILVNSPEVNAFVAGGPNIFIYTGLLLRAETPEEIIGVIAHELGHITGGHLSRARSALKDASYETIIGTILGVGAAILSGKGEAVTAVTGAAQNYAASKYLAHSRVQESSADQAGFKYLERAGIHPEGLVSFLKKLQADSLLPETQQSEYFRTHPITRNRITALQNRINASDLSGKTKNKRWADQLERMQAKLWGFITPEQVKWRYEPQVRNIPTSMAYAIAAYQQSNEKDAVHFVRQLVSLEPDNPYYHELEGQILADFGRLEESRKSYAKAHKLAKADGLIAIAYAHILIESANKDEKKLNEAIKLLHRARNAEPRSTRLYRFLATAYGRLGDNPRAKLYLAEEAYLQRRRGDTIRLAKIAQQGLPEDSLEKRRAEDLIFFANQIKPPKAK